MPKTLTMKELNSILHNTSPHSQEHNVRRYLEALGVATNTEPTLSTDKLGDTWVNLLFAYRNSLESVLINLIGEHDATATSKDILTEVAAHLSTISILTRSVAMRFGLRLEDIDNAAIGCVLNDTGLDCKAAIRTMMFGVNKPRHPYENVERDVPMCPATPRRSAVNTLVPDA